MVRLLHLCHEPSGVNGLTIMFDKILEEFEDIEKRCDELIKTCNEELPHWAGNIYTKQSK